MLGLGFANMTGVKVASGGGGSGTVISLLHGEDDTVVDSAVPPATFSLQGTGGEFFTDTATYYYQTPAPVGSKLVTIKFPTGYMVKSNTFAGIPINTPFTLEGYFLTENISGSSSFEVLLAGVSSNFMDGKYAGLSINRSGSFNFRAGTTVSFNQNLSIGDFHFIRIAFDGTHIRAYLNGNLSIFSPLAGTVDLSEGFYISFQGVPAYYWSFDEFRVTIGQALGAGMPTFPLTTTP